MNQTVALIALLAALVPCGAGAQERAGRAPQADPAAGETNRLAVKRVVLYKNGVGYFEHLGDVKDNQSVVVAFTSGQLDDVLKSLTVLDLDGGRITGVTYGSSAPLERQMAELRLATAQNPKLAQFLGGLGGARVELKTGTTALSGRLMGVERKTRAGPGTIYEPDFATLYTDGGELKTMELTPGTTVRLLERGLSATVDKFLDLESQAREPDQRRMTITTAGAGQRRLFVSYISETPVWKATYRIVLPEKEDKSPLLQGWAIVDNTGAQDWDKVELSLVAGAPQSFIQNLSQPFYAHRPVVGVKESLSATPQTFESTLVPGGTVVTGTVRDPSGAVVPNAHVKVLDAASNPVGMAVTDANGRFAANAGSAGPVRLEVERPGFNKSVQQVITTNGQPIRQDVQLQLGSVAETVEVAAEATTTDSFSRVKGIAAGSGAALGSGAQLGRRVGTGSGGGIGSGSGGGFGGGAFRIGAGVAAAAQAQELGDLFEYKLKEPITILKSQSALVPILQASVKAEKVSIWNERTALAKPLRGLWLENSSGATLDGGSFSVLENDTFAGEGIFDSIRQGEKRLISYAVDLAVTGKAKVGEPHHTATQARVKRGVLVLVREEVESKTYTFRNEDASARTIVVEHPAREGYDLRSPVKPVETSAGWMRFRLEAPPHQTATLVVEEARPMEATYQVAGLNGDQVAFFVRERSIDKPLEEALRKVLAQKDVVAGFEAEKNAREEETKKIYDDQQRLRENMKALKGSAEERALLLRYTKQLNDQETRLEQLQKETEELEAKQAAAQEELDKMIQALAFDVKLT